MAFFLFLGVPSKQRCCSHSTYFHSTLFTKKMMKTSSKQEIRKFSLKPVQAIEQKNHFILCI